jgi:hypothetical protein
MCGMHEKRSAFRDLVVNPEGKSHTYEQGVDGRYF